MIQTFTLDAIQAVARPTARVLIVLIATLCALSFGHAGEDRTLESNRLGIAERLKTVLRDSLECRASVPCTSSDNLFVSPSRSGLAVEVFGVVNHETAAKLLASATLDAAALPRDADLTVEIISDSKAADLKRPAWRSRNATVRATIQGGSNAKR